MIDTSKIKPGDTGTIRVTFESVDVEGVDVSFTLSGASSGHMHFVPASIIASHTPAPWVPEPGDDVAWSAAGGLWRIIAIDGEAIWIGYGKDHMTTTAKCLTLIRKGAA